MERPSYLEAGYFGWYLRLSYPSRLRNLSVDLPVAGCRSRGWSGRRATPIQRIEAKPVLDDIKRSFSDLVDFLSFGFFAHHLTFGNVYVSVDLQTDDGRGNGRSDYRERL